jgi:AraC-like DNA-binding protein
MDTTVYASDGVMSVQTDEGTWVVPPNRGVWIPAGVGHSIAMSGRVAMRTIYFLPALVETLPRRCCVIKVSPLRREVPAHRRLVEFMLDQLRVLPTLPLELPMPRDARALRAALRIRDAPGERATLSALAKVAGASRRTLERVFLAETHMTFGRWRQQARMLHAVPMLARGESVTTTALECGYDSTSAFIEVFTAVLGTTPGRYYRTT